MYKWLGSILIIASCTGIGFSKSQDMRKHLEELEELKKLFYLLKSELQYTRAPFAEVFEKIGRKANPPFDSWLFVLASRLQKKGTGSFCEIWKETIQEKLQECRLCEEEFEELKQIGKSLEYMESIDLYIEQLEYKIEHTREEYKTKKKLCQSMGIMGGIFLVILLL